MPDTSTVTKAIEISFDWQHLLDILKWPIFFLVIVLIFRKQIIDLINRITKFGHGGTTFEAQQQLAAERQENKKMSSVDRALGLFRPETTETFQSAVMKETDIENLAVDKEKIDRLVKYSIALYIIKHFESIYNSIFGSQIYILQQLNTFTKEDFASLKRFYSFAVEKNPKYFEGYSYEDYMEFLFSFNLIVDDAGQIKITVMGIDFLKYLTETGKNLNKRN